MAVGLWACIYQPVTNLCSGYILGEYGHVIANEPGYSPIEQFQVLHSKSQFCMAPTRALLLSTYVKWVNVFPEIIADQLVGMAEVIRAQPPGAERGDQE